MSIEQLQGDLQQVVEAATAIVSPDAILPFLQNNLFPWLESMTEEMAEMDSAIEEAYHEMPDVLHSESAEVFAGIIASGTVLVAELRRRVGNDQRLLAMAKEWTQLAAKGKEILEEITIPDPEEGDEETQPDGEPPALPPAAPEGGTP